MAITVFAKILSTRTKTIDVHRGSSFLGCTAVNIGILPEGNTIDCVQWTIYTFDHDIHSHNFWSTIANNMDFYPVIRAYFAKRFLKEEYFQWTMDKKLANNKKDAAFVIKYLDFSIFDPIFFVILVYSQSQKWISKVLFHYY